jgi:hypothetical protein
MSDDEDKRLAQFGMTEREIELWLAVAGVAERLGQLPELHPTARHEMSHAIARLQDLLLARPGMRAQGWGTEPAPADPGPEEMRRRLADFGMTDPEIDLWFAMSGVAGGLLELPPISSAEMERHEAAHAAHRVQDFILARPGRRVVLS